MSKVSRRDFLKLTRDGILYLSGALAFGGLVRFLDFQTSPAPKTRFELGPAGNYPLNSQTILAEIPAVLIHSESGFSALSLVCTHLGCGVEKKAQDFSCPCHGSRFDKDGNVARGPAVKKLLSLHIELTEDNQLILYTES